MQGAGAVEVALVGQDDGEVAEVSGDLTVAGTWAGLGPAGWDVSCWTGVVLFEGWESWWDGAQAAAPATCRRLRAFLEPATGHRLPASDVVHGDLNLTNVLARNGTITGVVDWDDVGVGTRATDLAGLLFDWHRLRLADEPEPAPDGDQRLVGRIVELAGGQGLRCTVAYGTVARLGLSAQRGENDEHARSAGSQR